MRNRSISLAGSVVTVLAITSVAMAAPARQITSPPVTKGPNPNTGPSIDPLATQGQWFQRPTGLQESRGYEFYDNVPQEGGGGAGAGAIRGQLVAPIFASGPGSTLTGFSIVASITNDLPGLGVGQPGRNSHNESLNQTFPGYAGPMFDVKLTAEFALPGLVQVPAGTMQQIANDVAPYSRPPGLIYAKGEDQLGWFCYTPNAGALGGDYLVPTWDFGNIPVGATVTRTLSFNTNIASTDPLYIFLLGAGNAQADLLLNRTTDLKIGNWVDALAVDTGAAYQSSPLLSGNVSVFFNVPEPTTLASAAGLSLLIARRAKR